MDLGFCCENCRHWSPCKDGEPGYGISLGRCDATPMYWESTEWTEDGDGRRLTAEAIRVTAFVQDASDYSATLYTKAEHACSMHEPAGGGAA